MYVIIDKDNNIKKLSPELPECFSIYTTVNDAVEDIWNTYSKKEIDDMNLKVVVLEEDSLQATFENVKGKVRRTYFYFRNIFNFFLLFWKK